jgi:outer membrane lipopolysaccharide assembly protein LptE/RlpB
MGMYDYVDAPPLACPECGQMISGWQSKDADCNLDRISISQVQEFYALCQCGVWAEYRLRRPSVVTLNDFELTITKPTKENTK